MDRNALLLMMKPIFYGATILVLMSENSQQNLHPKRLKSLHKKRAAKKKMKRRQNQSLQKLYKKIRKSTDPNVSMNSSVVGNTSSSCILINESMDNSKKDIHDLTDGHNVLFVEDRTGDSSVNITVLNNASPRRQIRKDAPKGRRRKSRPLVTKKSDTITLSDDDERTQTPLRNRKPISMFSSTPIANKSNNFDISKISAVAKISTNSSISREIRKMDNLTQEISGEEFVTIDLTHGTRSKGVIDLTRSRNNSVIDLEEGECSLSSMSISETETTQVNAEEWKRKKERLNEKDIAAGIAQMNASEKGRLLQLITDNIFNGCKTPAARKIPPSKKNSAEDTYIREMLEGSIRDSIGDNVYNPLRGRLRTGLRMIVIDGSNVAMMHGMKRTFSVKGLKICIDYFLKRGHTVKAFVPQYRCLSGKSSDPHLLSYLESRGLVVFTPSRKLDGGRCFSSYDDRFIVQCAAEFDGVIISQDRYRDLVDENPGWRQTIEKRLLQYTWVQDMIMFPLDPLGKNGPSLDQFLRHPEQSGSTK